MQAKSLPLARFSSTETQHMYDLLSSKHVGVLATGVEKSARLSVIYYSVDDSFEVQFATKDGTRKYADLQEDARVQLIVFDAKKQVEVCVEGRAEQVMDGITRTKIVNELYKIASKESDSAPPISKLYVGDYVAYTIRPTKITTASFLDYRGGDSRIFRTLQF